MGTLHSQPLGCRNIRLEIGNAQFDCSKFCSPLFHYRRDRIQTCHMYSSHKDNFHSLRSHRLCRIEEDTLNSRNYRPSNKSRLHRLSNKSKMSTSNSLKDRRRTYECYHPETIPLDNSLSMCYHFSSIYPVCNQSNCQRKCRLNNEISTVCKWLHRIQSSQELEYI